MKKVIGIFLCMGLLFSMFIAPVFAIVEPSGAERFALTEILKIAAEKDDLCKWTEDTQIKDEFVLYDLTDQPNGYIYTLVTNNKETGYIQIDAIGDTYSLHSYSFDGTNEVFHMLRANKLITEPFRALQDSKKQKVYYVGNQGYAIEKNGELIDLLSNKAISQTRTELLNLYEEYIEMKQAISRTGEIEQGSTMVRNYTSLALVSMDDFVNLTVVGGHVSTVENHCTPTAGTNVIKYFAMCQDIDELWKTNNISTFKAIYLAMNTNDVQESEQILSGTYWDIFYSDGYSGLLDYIDERGVNVVDSDRYALGAISGISIETIKEKIRWHYPVMLSVRSFPGSAGGDGYHSVVAFGYKNDRLILSNGWDSSYHYYTYSNLNVQEYYYVGFGHE